MTLQAIRDGLYTTLTACGPYDTTAVSACSFDPLEGLSACAIVFTPGTDTTIEQLTFGNQSGTDYARWSIMGSVYLKDTGDPRALLSKAWQAHDDFRATVAKDRSLNNSAANAQVVRFIFDPSAGVQAGGQYWAEIKWAIIAEEFEN